MNSAEITYVIFKPGCLLLIFSLRLHQPRYFGGYWALTLESSHHSETNASSNYYYSLHRSFTKYFSLGEKDPLSISFVTN